MDDKMRAELYMEVWLHGLTWDAAAEKFGLTSKAAQQAFATEQRNQEAAYSNIRSLSKNGLFCRLANPATGLAQVLSFYGPINACVTVETAPCDFTEELARALCGEDAREPERADVTSTDMLPTDLLHMIEGEGWVPMTAKPMLRAYLMSRQEQVTGGARETHADDGKLVISRQNGTHGVDEKAIKRGVLALSQGELNASQHSGDAWEVSIKPNPYGIPVPEWGDIWFYDHDSAAAFAEETARTITETAEHSAAVRDRVMTGLAIVVSQHDVVRGEDVGWSEREYVLVDPELGEPDIGTDRS